MLSPPAVYPIPYDGLQSNISAYAAGFVSEADLSNNPRAVSVAKRIPVCGKFTSFHGPNGWVPVKGIVTAASQLHPLAGGPATDVYINTNPKVLKHLSQATILHEALHNLTGMYDDDLESTLGIPAAKCTKGSICITEALRNAGCAGVN